jgi:nitrogen fixation/metabolism regulation signal transduction histidine kinase
VPDGARLCNAEGELVAQNSRSRNTAPPEKGLFIHELGDGMRLETWPAASAAHPDLRALANGLAHTLRNPLSSIMTAADLVKDDEGVSEESAMLLGIIAKESRQLNRILTDFLNYVRPRSNPPTEFDLAKALRDVVTASRREGVLSEDLVVDDELPEQLLVWGDEIAVQQALQHVVKNAGEAIKKVHAESAAARLHLCSEMEDARRAVHVTDSGPGFTDQSLRRAFEPFFTDLPECAGLGLTVALAAVERSGGRILIKNMRDSQNEYSNGRPQGAQVCVELYAPHPESN